MSRGMQDRITYFDIFFRSVPDDGGFAIAAGLEQAIGYVQQLHFDEDDIAYLRGRKMFSEGFLRYRAELQIHRRHLGRPGGDADLPERADHDGPRPGHRGADRRDVSAADAEPSEPDRHEGQPRDPRGAKGRTVLEFGSRRAQGSDAAVLGARAAYIGGCKGTACTLTDRALRRAGRRHDGPFVGADVRHRNTRRSRRTAKLTRTTPRCWWTPIIH